MGTIKKRGLAADIEAELQQQATAAAIASARKVIGGDHLPAGTPIGKLNDTELGWIVMSGVGSWIAMRAQQASAEGFSLVRTERFITGMDGDPPPWDAGAIAQILPNVAEIPGMPWDMPIGAWPKDDIIRFLHAAFDLIRESMKSRDAGMANVCPAPVLNDAVPF